MIKEANHLGMALGIPCLDGRTVYRDIFIGEGGYVICYEMEGIEKKLGFGKNSLISLAVLLVGVILMEFMALARLLLFSFLLSWRPVDYLLLRR
ncbi:hypothetical protein ACP4OV_029439 [Aristida adscensionis]